ncbi:MAG: M23 family peptidase, partial [Pseudomonadota bacterium]|nr:M23 family peptidase [Pseudomonadota bacterium]
MLKNILIFLIGALVGANVLYFIAVRDRPAASGPVVAIAPTPDDVATASAPPISAPVATVPQPTPVPPAPSISGLIVPVAGITATQLTDTFTDARGADRIHDAIDIMASEGTPVFAVADGS